MRRFDVIFEGFVTAFGADGAPLQPDDDLQDHLGEVMNALIEHDPKSDPAVGMKAATGGGSGAVAVEVNVTVSASQPDEAVVQGFSLIRSAVHTAGGFTPGWEIDWLRVEANPSEAEKKAVSDDPEEELVEA